MKNILLTLTALLLLTIGLSQTTYTVIADGPVHSDSTGSKIIPQGPEVVREVTAYTLRPEETDSTPCETALGPRVDICEWSKREQLCAGPYPLRTRLLVGDIECIVVDRLNPKYYNRIDLVMASVDEAREWGRKSLVVTIIK